MRWLTFEACRKVYIFFYFALPFALILLFLFPDNRWLPILLIAARVCNIRFTGPLFSKGSSATKRRRHRRPRPGKESMEREGAMQRSGYAVW
ncbi:hypothetical protein FE782_31185 [Paenibacillus antri]|uniref:Uncharacterized protein n=1 Tax=Paenibacillus antri TaxID=2582848 RepID=A0A5R9FXX0_9BACL|nr:hypothetical protein [Paenibacillus antri]TLS48331.1 hypothetical protein FE782_31185 [Paenibacillus antri]